MYKKLSSFAGLILILFSAYFSACNKSSDVGFNLIPEKYILDPYADTFPVAAYTYKIDSLATNNVSKVLLGSYMDPIFGTTKASFVTEMRPSGTFTKGDNPHFDSIVMYLNYDTITAVYGNSNIEHQFNIYEIKKKLSVDSIYYSNLNPIALSPELITSARFVPSNVINKQLIIYDDTLTNTLAIRLNQSFGQRLFDDNSQWSDTTFSTYFNGFYIESDDPAINGSISIFNLLNAQSKVSLYYNDTLSFDFNFNTYCARFNLFEHDFSSTNFNSTIQNPGVTEDSVVYIQGAAGLRAKVTFPYLENLRDEGNWAVSRAELVVHTESNTLSYESIYAAPSQLIIVSIGADGGPQYLSEFLYNSVYQGVPYQDDQYVFDITFIIQKIIKGEVANNGFMLMLNDGSYNPARTVLTSGNHSNKMKLILNLTKL